MILTMVLITIALTGCSKHIPATTDDFSTAKNLVVTLRDGEQVKGKIEDGENVLYVTRGRIYRATVDRVIPGQSVVLRDAYLEEKYDDYETQRRRYETSELRIEDEEATEIVDGRITIPYRHIVSVEETTLDKFKSARRFVFWGFTALVGGFILSAAF